VKEILNLQTKPSNHDTIISFVNMSVPLLRKDFLDLHDQ